MSNKLAYMGGLAVFNYANDETYYWANENDYFEDKDPDKIVRGISSGYDIMEILDDLQLVQGQ